MTKRQWFVMVTLLLLLLLVVVPGGTVSAGGDNASGGKILTVEGFMGRVSSIVNSVIPFIVGLAVFVIIWGLFLYIAKADEEEKRSEGRQFILWGIIGLFFMLSVWGFINILLGTFNLKRTIDASDIPRVPMIGGSGGGEVGGNNNSGNEGGDPGGIGGSGF